VWDSLEQVWGSECAAGGFVVCVCVFVCECVCVCVCVCVLRPRVCAACETVWSRFGGVRVQQVALCCGCVCVCVCVCVCLFVCCVYVCLHVRVCVCVCVLRASMYVCVCCVCVLHVCVCCMCVCVLRVGQFGASLEEMVCSRWLCGVCVCRHHVVMIRRIYSLMASILRIIHLFHESLLGYLLFTMRIITLTFLNTESIHLSSLSLSRS